MAAMKCNGREAVTNFDPTTYEGEIIVGDNGPGTNRFQCLSEFPFY